MSNKVAKLQGSIDGDSHGNEDELFFCSHRSLRPLDSAPAPLRCLKS
jgi:hypothetical protein